MKLLSEYNLRGLQLKNRLVMAPLTRSRAIDNIPNDLMAEYYSQRAGAGLIITEGTAPSPNGLGYARIPGIYSDAQIKGWKKITTAVHDNNGKIFLQIMHTGRVSHPANMPENAEVIAPSSVQLSGQMYTDTEGMQDYPTPREMSLIDILQTQAEYVQAAKNAMEAGFDGVELHGANGYLIEQFINPASNKRNDNYGGSIENRNRFAIETAQKVANAIGGDKTGIRLSPYGVFNDIEIFKGINESFNYLSGELGKLDLAYIHIVDHSGMGTPEVPQSIKSSIKTAFGGTIIISGGLDKAKAEAVLESGHGELVAFGRPYIANPDLANRFARDLEIAEPDSSTFYTPGAEGYTDYPTA
ncbi:MAG: alkene reductase [Saprospiraceae bacterium]|nr:alkene reductase [Saprospiraceae bacterium]